jgi:RNA-directed DNA polymerase
VDGETFADIEAAGRDRWLGELREEVRNGRYKPQPVRRVMIPKASGVGQRPLGIPTIRDRVVQAAAVLVLEPIFEADFDEAAHGYRPKRSALDAVRTVSRAIDEGHTEVVDADLSKYFGAPGQAGRFQRVQFPPRQGERAAPPGIEPWAHGGNDMG